MTRSIGDDELALGGSKVTVGDVDGDALLTLGFETVSEKSEVDVLVSTFTRAFLDRV